MDDKSVDALLNNLMGLLKLIRDAHIKISALERALEEQNPVLYQTYLKKKEETEQNPAVSFSLEGITNLRAILLQDRS